MKRSKSIFILLNIFFIGTTAQAFYVENVRKSLGRKLSISDVKKGFLKTEASRASQNNHKFNTGST